MYDFIVVGGGIVGLSTGLNLYERYPEAKVLILEKESDWATHQTGHNSGVIHSGIYYTPGSLKARMAREGNRAMVAFCQKHGIDHDICGKVIVATDEDELKPLENLFKRGQENGLNVRYIEREELKEIEPHVNGVAAIHVPDCGIVNYRDVCLKMVELIKEHGGDLQLETKVSNIVEQEDQIRIETNRGSFEGSYLINCAGLQSDRVAKMAGYKTDVKIVPFRGEYYKLKPEKINLVRNLIYPVPNPEFPFLGVHFTRMINGEVEAGPNAVLGLKREGYKKTDFHLFDALETLFYKGFRKIAWKYMRPGLDEMTRSFSKKKFVKSLQKLIPEVRAEDLEPAPAGVRAQALKADGQLVDDFYLVQGPRAIHVCNAPSPAATASLEIGKHIVEKIQEHKDKE